MTDEEIKPFKYTLPDLDSFQVRCGPGAAAEDGEFKSRKGVVLLDEYKFSKEKQPRWDEE